MNKTILEQVKVVLEDYPDSRSQDWALVYHMYREFYSDRDWFLIPFETIIRDRRILQRKFPELRPCEKIYNERQKKAIHYKERLDEAIEELWTKKEPVNEAEVLADMVHELSEQLKKKEMKKHSFFSRWFKS